jgi:hypothetical protein
VLDHATDSPNIPGLAPGLGPRPEVERRRGDSSWERVGMNPDLIYREHRDDALASQVTAEEYTTFVAMPFGERFSYQSREVFNRVICAAAARATERGEAARPFARPVRGDDLAGVAGVITEDIIVKILESHFFVADLTFANPGVLLEAGTALGLKPNGQIILLLQGDPGKDLHFDIRNNRVIPYDPDGKVEEIATAFIAAAGAFERDRQKYVESVTRSLSPEAIASLFCYALSQQPVLQQQSPGKGLSIYRGLGDLYEKATSDTRVVMHLSMRELIAKRLMFGAFESFPLTGDSLLKLLQSTESELERRAADALRLHATELGWVVIKHFWPALGRTEPARSPTSPA